MKKKLKVKVIEGLTLVIAVLLMGFFYTKELGNWRYIGILGFAITGFMWTLPVWVQDTLQDDDVVQPVIKDDQQDNNSA